jgi:uncharacterized membrane protein YbhN (UPF0104 family)
MQEFFTANLTIITIIHLFGFALGLGGATIADIMFFRFLKDLTITEKEKEALSIISIVIFSGLFILYLSGIGLVLSNPEKFLNSAKFLTKAFIVGVITINGIILHKVITPKLIHIHWHIGSKAEKRNLRKLAFACGAISVLSWYTSFILGSISAIPVTAITGIIIYLTAATAAVIVSQIIEYIYSKTLD